MEYSNENKMLDIEDFGDLNSSPNLITSGEEVLYDLLFSDELNLNKNKSYSSNSSDSFKRQSIHESFAYLQELNSFHIDRLQSEPSILHEKKQNIQEEIKNLAFSNYKTFIQTAQCSRDIYSEFSVIENKLDELILNLPEFSQTCENFTKNIQNINQSRRTNNLTLQKHNQLLEILEISQLMDTCVRNEYYEEALDLATYVKRLEKKYASNISLIQQIVNDVNKSLNLMLKQLLQQLKTNLQFNQCLKIIGIIRRLDVFTESELRIKFLQLRDSWLQTLLQQIPQDDPYHHISKTIEENRIHLFDIITQYRAIFSDDDILTSSSSISSAINQDKLLTSLLTNNKDLNESKLFYSWLQQKLKNFLFVLKKDLSLGVGNRLDSVLSQAMYFGLAFSRVGLDFRSLMVPIFEQAVLQQVKKNLDSANLKFDESLSKTNWSELYIQSSKTSLSLKSLDLNLYESNRTKNLNSSSNNTSILNPPIQLLEFQPLAVYLNTLLQCFNELRLCAPLNIYMNVLNELKNSFRKISKRLKEYHNKEKLDKNEFELFSNFLYQLSYTLVPFVEKCFSYLFPIEQLQKVYSIQQQDLHKLKQALKLDYKNLFVDIYEMIPAQKQEELEVKSNDLEDKKEIQKVENELQEEKSEETQQVVEETVEQENNLETETQQTNEDHIQNETENETEIENKDETNKLQNEEDTRPILLES